MRTYLWHIEVEATKGSLTGQGAGTVSKTDGTLRRVRIVFSGFRQFRARHGCTASTAREMKSPAPFCAVEEWFLARPITWRRRFESGLRNQWLLFKTVPWVDGEALEKFICDNQELAEKCG